MLKLVSCLGILAVGIACFWLYALRPATASQRGGPTWGERPWRRVGAGICLVLAIMFVLGVYVVDIPDHPRTYATFWLVMMGLVMWLCVLATRDVFHTRRIIAQRRAQIRARQGREAACETDGDHR